MSDSEEEEVADLSSNDVTTKYMCAAGIANEALQLAIEKCVPGADIYTVCQEVDALVMEKTGKVYNKKGDKAKVEKGIAFPCCISQNEICGNFSPLPKESAQLVEGALAKIDVGAHIDGFVGCCAHTIVVGKEKVTDRRADVLQAAWTSAEAALRMVQTGKKNSAVTEMLKRSATAFGCSPVQGVLSHQVKKHVIDGNQCILNCETPEEHVDEFEFGMNEVYVVDVLVSTGEGKAKETENRTTVFKRALENTYALKTQKARQFLAEVGHRFPTLPFSLRAFDETVGRVGASEANRHELLHPYPVLQEKKGEYVAQFKFTVLLLPGGTKKVTGFPLDPEACASEKKVEDEELAALLRTSANPKKKKKKDKK